jgi:cell division protein ZapA
MPSSDVYILGQKYSIKGATSKKHIEELADFINSRIKEVLDKTPNIPPTKALILAMFNMAEEMSNQSGGEPLELESIQKKADELARLFE